MIRAIDIQNAGIIVFSVGALYYFGSVAAISAWVRFVIIAGLLLMITATVIWAVELPGRAEKAFKKTRSLQAFCQDHHISYVLKVKKEDNSFADFGRPRRAPYEGMNFDLALKESGVRKLHPGMVMPQ